MAAERLFYGKLSKRSLMSVQTAHLGEDHLLVVDGQYTETYKRLYYNDIEAILVCPSKYGMLTGVIFSLLTLCFILPAFWAGWEFLPLAIICGGASALVALVIFWGKGSVTFGVKTAVQTVVLKGVNTRRKAAKAEARLAAEIERVQGDLTEEALSAFHSE